MRWERQKKLSLRCVSALKIHEQINEKSWNKWQNKMVISKNSAENESRALFSSSSSDSHHFTIVERNLLAPCSIFEGGWKKNETLNNKLWKHEWFFFLSFILLPTTTEPKKSFWLWCRSVQSFQKNESEVDS